ncbi:hypothetical protein E2C01_061990 [Portunus trituberculatus]|uniref:Uncharacterized protein n=1 Tax=Portunus trituberculatus TaxID=210409 RepID=A0A5B7HGT4_PORTR|nr:hypothetical protein [Portunus trituberculatus]
MGVCGEGEEGCWRWRKGDKGLVVTVDQSGSDTQALDSFMVMHGPRRTSRINNLPLNCFACESSPYRSAHPRHVRK